MDDEQLRDLLFRVCNLATSALSAFSGFHAETWPFFPDQLEELPWLDEYWTSSPDGYTLINPEREAALQEEVRRVAEILMTILERDGQGDTLLDPFGAVWACEDLMATPKGRVQGMAVQALYCADQALDDLLRGRILSGANNFGRAYDGIFLLHLECQPLYGGAKKLGRQGGIARGRNDPRSRDKELVRQCWEAWITDPSRYSSTENFARDMLQKTEHLAGSTQVIARWVRTWRRDSPKR